jgi:undecaprenyl-diphosphatase
LKAKGQALTYPLNVIRLFDEASVAFALLGLPRRALLFGLLALLICLSRIFVGTHYLADVLGGSLTGVVAALLV